jgi:hypothetical protein
MLLTRHGLVDRLAIICAIRDEADDLAVNLFEQSGNFAYVVGSGKNLVDQAAIWLREVTPSRPSRTAALTTATR